MAFPWKEDQLYLHEAKKTHLNTSEKEEIDTKYVLGMPIFHQESFTVHVKNETAEQLRQYGCR